MLAGYGQAFAPAADDVVVVTRVNDARVALTTIGTDQV